LQQKEISEPNFQGLKMMSKRIVGEKEKFLASFFVWISAPNACMDWVDFRDFFDFFKHVWELFSKAL